MIILKRKGRKERGNHTVFKIHAGIKAIACLDNVSAEFFFKASPEVLDRDGQKRFGPFSARPALMNGAHPLVFETGQKHRSVRVLKRETPSLFMIHY